jgi:hypothetical protein
MVDNAKSFLRPTGLEVARAILHSARVNAIDLICSVQSHMDGALHGGETVYRSCARNESTSPPCSPASQCCKQVTGKEEC